MYGQKRVLKDQGKANKEEMRQMKQETYFAANKLFLCAN